MRLGATIRGRVLLNGEPWRGKVAWKAADGTGGYRERTETDGRYELGSVGPGPVQLVVQDRSSRLVYATRDLVVEAGNTYEEDFALEEERATISGMVTSPTGTPVPDAVVTASSRDGRGLRWFRAKTAADGTYAVEVASSRLFQTTAPCLGSHVYR